MPLPLVAYLHLPTVKTSKCCNSTFPLMKTSAASYRAGIPHPRPACLGPPSKYLQIFVCTFDPVCPSYLPWSSAQQPHAGLNWARGQAGQVVQIGWRSRSSTNHSVHQTRASGKRHKWQNSVSGPSFHAHCAVLYLWPLWSCLRLLRSLPPTRQIPVVSKSSHGRLLPLASRKQ